MVTGHSGSPSCAVVVSPAGLTHLICIMAGDCLTFVPQSCGDHGQSYPSCDQLGELHVGVRLHTDRYAVSTRLDVQPVAPAGRNPGTQGSLHI